MVECVNAAFKNHRFSCEDKVFRALLQIGSKNGWNPSNGALLKVIDIEEWHPALYMNDRDAKNLAKVLKAFQNSGIKPNEIIDNSQIEKFIDFLNKVLLNSLIVIKFNLLTIF